MIRLDNLSAGASSHSVGASALCERLGSNLRFEPVTPAFGGQYSIQLSYGRIQAAIVVVAAQFSNLIHAVRIYPYICIS